MVLTSPEFVEKSELFVPRKSYARLPRILDVPNLIKVQLDSFQRFQEKGLKQLLQEVSPIHDITGNRLELSFVAYELRDPRPGRSEQECQERDLTYSVPLYVRVRLLVKETGEIKEQDLFFGDIPLMTAKGTFITSGAERVVVSQLLRSPGVYFTTEEDTATGHTLCFAKNELSWAESSKTINVLLSTFVAVAKPTSASFKVFIGLPRRLSSKLRLALSTTPCDCGE